MIYLSEINSRFHELENILAPVSLAKNCVIAYDKGLKLCDGLGSSVRLRGGEYKVSDYAYRILVNGEDQTEMLKGVMPQIAEVDRQLKFLNDEFELRISEGIAARDNDGRIMANVRFQGVTKSNAAAMQLMGIDQMLLVTGEKFLSVDHNNPTMFEATQGFGVTKGALIPQLFGGPIETQTAIAGEVLVRAAAYTQGGLILGWRC